MKNQVFESLSAECKAAILDSATLVHCKKNSYTTVSDAGVTTEVVFPLTAVFGTVIRKFSTASEVLLIRGNDSIVGNVFETEHLDGQLCEEVVVVGDALVIRSADFIKIREVFPEINAHLLQATLRLTTHLFQEVRCARNHTSIQRFADRTMRLAELCNIRASLLKVTTMGEWIGVKRSTTLQIVSELRDSGILEISGQYLRVRDMSALKLMSCGCLQTLRDTDKGQLFLEFQHR